MYIPEFKKIFSKIISFQLYTYTHLSIIYSFFLYHIVSLCRIVWEWKVVYHKVRRQKKKEGV